MSDGTSSSVRGDGNSSFLSGDRNLRLGPALPEAPSPFGATSLSSSPDARSRFCPVIPVSSFSFPAPQSRHAQQSLWLTTLWLWPVNHKNARHRATPGQRLQAHLRRSTTSASAVITAGMPMSSGGISISAAHVHLHVDAARVARVAAVVAAACPRSAARRAAALI